MGYCEGFVERRSAEQLRATPLRRRMSRPAVFGERRQTLNAPDIAGMMELNLDRHRTKAAMIEFLQDMIVTLDARQSAVWAGPYTQALRQALSTVRRCDTPVEAVASLHGCQRKTVPALSVVG